MMNFFKCFYVFCFMASYMFCLESVMKTFQAIMEDTEIDAFAFESHTVNTISSCGLMCGSKSRCLSFTLCEKSNQIFSCRLFDKDYWETEEIKTSTSCTYYEEQSMCDRNLKGKLLKKLTSLDVIIPNHLLLNAKKFACSNVKARRPQYNQTLEIIKVTKSRFLSFDIKRTENAKKTSDYQDVLSIVGVKESLAVLFQPNSFDILIRAVRISGTRKVMDYVWKELGSQSFVNFLVIQNKNENGNYIYRVFVDGIKVHDDGNFATIEELGSVVQFSNFYYQTADVIVRNFVYSNLE